MVSNVQDVSRRAFLTAVGAAGGAAMLAPGAASAAPSGSSSTSGSPARGTGEYTLANGFLLLAGSNGAFRRIGVDPTGGGNYREPTTFTAAYLGQVDVFDDQHNPDVSWTRRGHTLRLDGISITGPNYSLGQSGNTGAPPKMTAGQVYAQGFTVEDGATVTGLSMLLATYGADSAGVTATVYPGTAAEPGPPVHAEKLTFGDNSTVSMQVPAIGPGRYVLALHDPVGTPSWWYHQGSPADVGGVATIDGDVLADTNFVFTATGYTGGGSASLTARLLGPTVRLEYRVQPADGTDLADPGFSLTLPWKRDGYSVRRADGVPFSRFVTSGGQYMPAQQLKRRPSWGTFGLGPADSITATGTGDYDLVLSAPDLQISGVSPIGADSMTLQLPGPGGHSSTSLTGQLDLRVRRHSDRLPHVFPEFLASDRSAAAALTTFWHERTLSAQQGAHATNGADWKDWTGRLYDWTPGAFGSGERASLVSIELDDDGYVWTENPSGSREWPFPAGDAWDSRHFTTNPDYILGVWRYYSWTGDEDFLATMLPRVRKAVGYLRNTLGGERGLLTLPGPDHDGRPGSIGSNYWDLLSFGHHDAYANLYFCGCLEPAAQLEEAAGDRVAAAGLRQLAAKAAARFRATFWDEDAGRFVSTVDADGNRHDYGSSFVNLEAMSFGLATPGQARRIYAWLEHGPTQLTTNLLMLRNGSAPPDTAPAGHSLGQSFTVGDEFAQVGLRLAAADPDADNQVTITLRRDGPHGALVGTTTGRWRGPSGWMPLNVPTQPAGQYYVQVQAPDVAWTSGPDYDGGHAYTDGTIDTSVPSRAVVVVSPYRDGPADIYQRFGWAPRTTSRKNNFWYFWGWEGVTVPYEQQLEDGGTDLYLSGFDVAARARYLGADNAWQRLAAVLDRWRDPDHLCGGDPLYRGEHPQNEVSAGSVGVDIPFPESGLAPNSFFETVLGVLPQPGVLTVTPRLPRTLSWAGVRRMVWQGRVCTLIVARNQVRLTGRGLRVTRHYRPGQTVRIRAPRG